MENQNPLQQSIPTPPLVTPPVSLYFRFKQRILFTIYGIVLSMILFYSGGFITAKLIPDSAGLAGLVYIFVFVSLFSQILPALISIFFFVGYRKDIAQSNTIQQTPWFVQFLGLLAGCIFGAYCYFLFPLFLWLYIDRFSYLGGILPLYSAPIFIFSYALFGFLFVQCFYFLFRFHSKKYIVPFSILFLLLIPFSVMLFIQNKDYYDKLKTLERQSITPTDYDDEMKIKKVTLSNVEIIPNPEFPKSPTRRLYATVILYSPVDIQAKIDAKIGISLQSGSPQGAINSIYDITKGEQQLVFMFQSNSCMDSEYKDSPDYGMPLDDFEISGFIEPQGYFPKLKAKSPPILYTDLVPLCN